MERPTLRQLEALDAIAREGSFRGAARALGVSQVAISDHIKQLETRLGVSLFTRSRGGKAAISPAGAAALTRARIILADCDALVTTMRDHLPLSAVTAPAVDHAAEAVSGKEAMPEPPGEAPDAPWTHVSERSDRPIIIGTHPSILARFQVKLAAFEDAFPHRPVSIDFNCFVADRVALGLSDGSLAMAYFYALGATRIFPSDYLWSERWSLYVARNHPLAALEFVGRDDVIGEPLLTFSATNRLRPLVDACMSGAGLGTMRVGLETDDYGQLAERAREGEGVLPLFGAAAARIGASSGLKRLPFVDPIPSIEVRRVIHTDLAEDDEVQALVATLQ
jgi:molybdate transport repressor ModE-like protein